MKDDAVRALKRTMLEAYGHFSDRRIRDIDYGSLFIIDDRSRRDIGAELGPNADKAYRHNRAR